MSFLVDTNVLSELRKGERGNPAVRRWLAAADDDALFLSVLVVGEIRKGVERLRNRDTAAAEVLETWVSQVTDAYATARVHGPTIATRNVADDNTARPRRPPTSFGATKDTR